MDANISLRERTVLIHGTFSSTVQSLMMGLSQLGADCVLVDTDTSAAQRFCSQINDGREVNEKFGRATNISANIKDLATAKDVAGKAAQTFGGLDVFIDLQTGHQPLPFKTDGTDSQMDEALQKYFRSSVLLTQAVIPFLKGRKKGRIVYVMNENKYHWGQQDLMINLMRSGLVQLAKGLSAELGEANVTVNSLSLGMTEEYILGHFPEAKSITEAVQLLKQKEPGLKITEPERITQTMAFLLGPSGLAIRGQHISLA